VPVGQSGAGLVKTVAVPAPHNSNAIYTTVTTAYTYTQLGDVLTVQVPPPNDTVDGQGNPVPVTYSYTYYNDTYAPDPAPGMPANEILGQPLAISDPLGHTTHIRYDGHGNITKI
jgi:uncharacterized protein RhaS with RHS repeats